MPFVPNVNCLLRECPETTGYMRRRALVEGRPPDAYKVVWSDLETVSPLLLCAVIKSEDPFFFRHHGLLYRQTWTAIGAALRTHTRIKGVSSITQQLARNLYLGPERTLARKLREALIARRLEFILGKPRIVELYLNTIEWGVSIWGCTSASRSHFHKEPAALDAFESTLLAAMVPAPRRPLSGANRERVWIEQSRNLYRFYLSGLIDSAECGHAMARTSAFHRALTGGSNLEEALKASFDGPAADVGATLQDVAPRLNDTPLQLDRVLELECGLDREIGETQRLEARYGMHALVRAVISGDPSALRAGAGT